MTLCWTLIPVELMPSGRSSTRTRDGHVVIGGTGGTLTLTDRRPELLIGSLEESRRNIVAQRRVGQCDHALLQTVLLRLAAGKLPAQVRGEPTVRLDYEQVGNLIRDDTMPHALVIEAGTQVTHYGIWSKQSANHDSLHMVIGLPTACANTVP